MQHRSGKTLNALKVAFPATIPILAGFLFLGTTYGILMSSSGFPILMTVIISLTVFAGSMQFVAVNLLLGSFNPLQAFFMTIMINARHLFYGISMLDKYKGMGLKKIYLIFGMCDESFSINYTAKVPENVDKGKYMTFVTLLNQSYWVAGSALGAIFGELITFNTEGIDFCMTAMFVVILTEQLLNKNNRISAIIGIILSVVCLAIFGPDKFIVPAMISILVLLSIIRKPLMKGEK